MHNNCRATSLFGGKLFPTNETLFNYYQLVYAFLPVCLHSTSQKKPRCNQPHLPASRQRRNASLPEARGTGEAVSNSIQNFHNFERETKLYFNLIYHNYPPLFSTVVCFSFCTVTDFHFPNKRAAMRSGNHINWLNEYFTSAKRMKSLIHSLHSVVWFAP